MCVCVCVGGGGGGGLKSPHSESLGGYPLHYFVLIQQLSKLNFFVNHETFHQGIINSWLCYSFLGEALGGFSNPIYTLK